MFHLNPDTGKVGRCKAEKQGCRFADPSDPNGGHYETVEEMDAYRERRAELEASGLQEGITETPIETAPVTGIKIGSEISSGFTVSGAPRGSGFSVSSSPEGEEIIEDSTGTATSGNHSVGAPVGIIDTGATVSATTSSQSQFSGIVPLPKDSTLKLPEGFERMSTKEKAKDFWVNSFTLKNPDGSTSKQGYIHVGTDFLQERKDYLNSAFGYDKKTGETFTDSISRRYKDHPSITSKIESLGKAGVIHSSRDTPFDTYQKDEITIHSYALMENGATIDFSNPDSLIEVQTSEDFYELEEANENVKLGIAYKASEEFDYSEEIGDIKGTGQYAYLNQNFAYRINKYLLDERDMESGETYHFYKEYLRGYAKKNGLEGKAPDSSIKKVFKSGYRMSERDIKSVVRESVARYRKAKYKGSASDCHMENALGDSITASPNGIAIGKMKIKGGFFREDRSDKDRVVLGYKEGGGWGPDTNLVFNPKTGEGHFKKTDYTYLGDEGRGVSNKVPDFKLTKKLPKDYTESDLRNFLMSEKIRYSVFNGKPWSKVSFGNTEK